ncbi:GntR family transcriptional regulator [Acrocarpospora macrocephala]|uniref:GntR family transcriptional regulator n=1 Tax=Acrocarpospora macrocephala TaxID=150177 RepID=A0A5M3WFH8_9ACTN|nr:GntR family transcriptional regulator [Acrocarpospora macrocephala]GES07089.1 GntR family transcriptional regulator [Acrocarpospora macrocephala]
MSALQPLGSTQKRIIERAYEAIKHAIQTMALAPGEALVESRLAADLQISKTPIREALVRLAQTGLVVSTPYKGYFVASLTLADTESIMNIRAVLEGLAARQACERASSEDLASIEELLVQARDRARDGDWAHVAEAGHAIHTAIHRLSGDERLENMIQVLNDQFDRVRLLSAQVPGRLPHSIDEHAAIVAAVRDRDAVLAEQLMRNHLLNVLDDVRQSAKFLAEAAPEPLNH